MIFKKRREKLEKIKSFAESLLIINSLEKQTQINNIENIKNGFVIDLQDMSVYLKTTLFGNFYLIIFLDKKFLELLCKSELLLKNAKQMFNEKFIISYKIKEENNVKEYLRFLINNY